MVKIRNLTFYFFFITFSNFAGDLKSNIFTICIGGNFSPCKKEQVSVDIFKPNKEIKASILVLNGWNFPRDDWWKKTTILKLAEEKGFLLIFPEMGKTLYESEFFPETTLKWNSKPSKYWFEESFFPQMEKFGYLKKGEVHFVMGLSTGGRGAVLMALNYPNLFKGVASFSGDFDQSKMPKDRLMTSVYGSFEIFPERWLGKDNPQNRLNEWILPIYLGHGKADKIVPFEQTKNFYESLKKLKPNVKVILNEPINFGHDYLYWESEVKPSFDFFESLIEKKNEGTKKYIFF